METKRIRSGFECDRIVHALGFLIFKLWAEKFYFWSKVLNI